MAVAKPSPAPAPPAKIQPTDLLDLMLRLADLLEHETELLRAGRVRDIAPLQNEKLRLTLIYDKAAKALCAAGLTLASMAPPLRSQFVVAGTRLACTVGENERALRVGRAATRRILDLVVESVRARQRPLLRYTAKLAPMRHMPALALTINQRL
jgi:hypothetical protein